MQYSVGKRNRKVINGGEKSKRKKIYGTNQRN